MVARCLLITVPFTGITRTIRTWPYYKDADCILDTNAFRDTILNVATMSFSCCTTIVSPIWKRVYNLSGITHSKRSYSWHRSAQLGVAIALLLLYITLNLYIKWSYEDTDLHTFTTVFYRTVCEGGHWSYPMYIVHQM